MKLILILQIIVMLENSPPPAVGYAGEVSVYQISRICLKDVNDEFETTYTFEQVARDIRVAKTVGHLYLIMLEDKYKCDSNEKVVRGFQGGPRGWKKSSTLQRWRDFQLLIKQRGIRL